MGWSPLRRLRPGFLVAAVVIAVVAAAGGTAAARYRDLSSALDGAHARLATVVPAGLAGVLAHAGASPLDRPTVILVLPADRSRAAEGVALLRLDPTRGLVSVLAIPGLLRVPGPAAGASLLGAPWLSGDLVGTIAVVHAFTGIAIDHVAVLAGQGIPSVDAVRSGDAATDLSAREAVALAWVDFRASRRLTCHLGGVPTTIAGASFLQASSGNAAALDAFLGVGAAPPESTADPLRPGCRSGA